MRMYHKVMVVRTFMCRHCKLYIGNASSLAHHLIKLHGASALMDGRKRKFYIEE